MSAVNNEPPPEGEYAIGRFGSADFPASAIFSLLSGGLPDISFSTDQNYTGTLVITSSSLEMVEGTFEFDTLDDFMVEDSPEVSVTNGVFKAILVP